MKSQKSLTLFFTENVSLQTWQNAGILAKEMELYKRYSESGWQVNLITYGDKSDLEIAKDYGFARVFLQSVEITGKGL